MAKATQKPDGIAELEDALKIAEQRIAQMKQERDEAYELVDRMKQHVEDADELIQQWISAEQLELGDNGMYQMSVSLASQYDSLRDKYYALIKSWNRIVPMIAPKDIGRPLAASEAQCKQVLKLHA